jgi:hypothetical protein
LPVRCSNSHLFSALSLSFFPFLLHKFLPYQHCLVKVPQKAHVSYLSLTVTFGVSFCFRY